MLKYFKVDKSRSQLVVDVEFYQMGLASIVVLAKTDPMFTDDAELPSWSKFAAAPVKGKGFFVNMLEAIFLGKHGADELNIDLQTGDYRSAKDTRVAMMFLSGSIRNDAMALVGDYAQQALPGYVVQVINGDETSNAKAEAMANDIIDQARREGKSVLLLSSGMAQRSFSVPAITELYLAYDSGDNGATIQKMSRALTPAGVGKVGRIISLSFDPNRDDKFDAIICETAQNYKRNHNKKSLKEAFADVLRTIDVFDCQPDGAVKIGVDKYLERAMARGSIARSVGKTASLHELSDEEIAALAKGNGDYFRAGKTEAADRGKTRDSIPKKGGVKTKKVTAKDIQKAREVIVSIVENMDIIVYGANEKTLSDAFAWMDQHTDCHCDIFENFGVEYHVIRHLFDNGIINSDIVELMYDVA